MSGSYNSDCFLVVVTHPIVEIENLFLILYCSIYLQLFFLLFLIYTF